MPALTSDGSSRDDAAVQGRLAAAISTAVVHVFSEHTGRGPIKARTTINGEMVVVILHDSMAKAERSLVAAVERLTASKVQVFMSANHIAPDTAAEIFLLDSKAGA